MDKLVDVSQPIEAVHASGRRVAMKVLQLNAGAYGRNDHWLSTADGSRFPGGPGSHNHEWASRDGDLPNQPGWHLRNTAKPSTPSNEELTQRMEIPQAIAQRMAKAWKALAQVDLNDIGPYFASNCVKTAQSIVSDLPKPVDPIDPDLIEAREICASRDGVDAGQANAFRNGSFDVGSNVPLVLAGIKLGRTLAAGGTAHE